MLKQIELLISMQIDHHFIIKNKYRNNQTNIQFRTAYRN